MKFLRAGRPSRRRTVITAAVTCAAALSLAACSSSSGSGDNSTGGSTSGSTSGGGSGKTTSVTVFNGSVGNFTENFNPLNNTGALLQPTNGVIYEALFYYNNAKAQDPVPVLGKSFSWNADGTKLTIHTRTGVKWTDGKSFSANDVAYTFNLMQSNKALNTSGATWTAKATSNSTVVVSFPKPGFTLEAQLLGNQAIVPQHIWKSISDPTKITNDHPVGTGPYMLKSFGAQSYVLDKNPNYWGTGANAPAIDEVRYISLSNADAATSALESGKVDWMGSYLPTLQKIVDSHPAVKYVNTPDSTTSLFTCSNASLGCKGPQTDVAVRQAIYYAMDRNQMNQQAVSGFAKPGSPTLLVPSVSKDFIVDPANATMPQSANVAKAKSLLQADGWTLGGNGFFSKNGSELDLSVNVVSGWTDYDTDTTLLKGQLKAAGINLAVNEVAQNAWTQAEVSGNFQLSMNSINEGASISPYYIYNNYLNSKATAKVGGTATTNVARFSDPQVDAAIKAIASTNDKAKQKAAYGTIQDAIVKDMPYIPLYVNQALTQFNTTHATGWPTADNLYAQPTPFTLWANGIVLKTIRPAN